MVSGSPSNYRDYFRLNRRTGVISQFREVDREVVEQFEMTLEARENTRAGRRATSKVIIKVEAKDIHPPELRISAGEGFVEENSGPGTLILDSNNNSITFSVTDQDLTLVPQDQRPEYIYEFTSAQFERNDDGELVVKTTDLDRDAPNQPVLMVQVVAREKLTNGKASAPVSIKINVKDQNDNPPILHPHPALTIQAGGARRRIATMTATDPDEDDSIRFRVIDVSNGGRRTFYVNPSTGVLEVLGVVRAGESYSLTVQARDNSGATSETILEVRVTPGPNIKPPFFDKFLYDVSVSEGAAKHTSVVTVRARDPEGDTVTYSIVSGDDDNHFYIGESTGAIRVLEPLDRETIKKYSLTVTAADAGGKSSNTTVNILITDINDQSPVFKNLPYSFRVNEGEVGSFVGRVIAEDLDEGVNANITYYIEDEDSPFIIDPITGKLSTKSALDFESHQQYTVTITARDAGEKVRSAMTSATVLVQDVSDETPYFDQSEYRATVPENMINEVVTTVTAVDKDTLPVITYRIMQGDVAKFMIDPSTGEIITIQPLDYERSKEHILVIGTEQAMLDGGIDDSKATTKVIITVTDTNDLAPTFTDLPPGNRVSVRNDAPLNEVLGNVQATDGDAFAPDNIVKYGLDGERSSERADKYFSVDTETGDIVLQGDLTNELFDEYRLAVKAYDLGEPSLETVTEIIVLVQQVATVAPNTKIGFTDLNHQLQVMENTPQEAVLKTLKLTNSPSQKIKIECKVIEAVDKDGNNAISLFKGKH